MAFLVVPVAGGAIGGLAGVSLAWSYTKAANATAAQLYGGVTLHRCSGFKGRPVTRCHLQA